MSVVQKPRTIEGLDRHPGKWVAIVDDKVIATADTLPDLREQVGERVIEGVLKVPPPRRGAGVFL